MVMGDYAKCARTGVVEFGDDFDTKKEVLDLFKLPDQSKLSQRIYDLAGPGIRLTKGSGNCYTCSAAQ